MVPSIHDYFTIEHLARHFDLLAEAFRLSSHGETFPYEEVHPLIVSWEDSLFGEFLCQHRVHIITDIQAPDHFLDFL